MGKTVARRMALFLVAGVAAFVWSGGGRAQAPCTVERGQDPLDVIKTDIRHNVWISLDTSGSMAFRLDDTYIGPIPCGPPGPCAEDTPDDPSTPTVNEAARLRIAKDVLKDILNEFVDASGRPQFNWGFVNFADNQNDSSTACDDSGCDGHNLAEAIKPPGCDDNDNRPTILAKLRLTAQGGVRAYGATPNGKALDQISQRIQTLYGGPSLPNLLQNQKNFIIHITDGEDTCEYGSSLCDGQGDDDDDDDDESPKLHRWSTTSPTQTLNLNSSPFPLPATPVTGPWKKRSVDKTYRRGYNAGLKVQIAYTRLNPTAADQLNASKGDIFIIGLGQAPPPYTTGDVTMDNDSNIATFSQGASLPTSGCPQYGNSGLGPKCIGPGDKLVINVPDGGTKTFYVKERLSSTQLVTHTNNTGPKINKRTYSITEEVAFQENMNHLGWEASGYKYGRPGRPAFPATNSQQLKDALRNALASIGIPQTTFTMGGSVVGSVPELIPVANSSVTASDILADTNKVDDAQQARVTRIRHRNNVLFSTYVDTPSFNGHLKAVNIYTVNNPGQPSESRTADLSEVWDAGAVLQQMDPDDRTILLNRRNSTQLVPFVPGSGSSGVDVVDLFGAAGAGIGFLSDLDGQGALSDQDAVAMVVGAIRGKRLSKHPVTGTFYKKGCSPIPGPACLNFSETEADGVTKTWKLYDPTGAGVAVVQYPSRSPEADPPQLHTTEYADGFPNGFYWDNINRQTVVFMGSNGGMMHAFAGDNGAELYAVINDDVLGPVAGEVPGAVAKLKDLVKQVVAGNNGVTNHKFFYSGAATVEDVFTKQIGSDPAKWRTVLAFGRARGGRGLAALDVTGIGDWDGYTTHTSAIPVGDPRLPKLLWNVGNPEGVQDGPADEHVIPGHGIFDDLGETWSLPVLGNVKVSDTDDQWVMFVGAGYGCSSSTQGEYLYAIKVEDGTVYQRVGGIGATTRPLADLAGAQIDHNQLVATPALYNPHHVGASNGMDFVTRVYIGDLQGNVYKLDTSSTDPSQWTFRVFYSFSTNLPTSGKDQPITAKAAIMKVPGVQDQVLVFVGTGGDFRVTPLAGESFYLAGIADNDQEGENNPGTLIQSTDNQNNTTRFLVSLPSTERVWVAPAVVTTAAPASGVVYFASTFGGFNVSTCDSSFTSRLWAFRAVTGQAASDMDSSQQGVQSSASLGEGKVAGLAHRDEHLYVTRSGGIGVGAATEVKGSDEFPIPATGAGGTVQVLSERFQYSAF